MTILIGPCTILSLNIAASLKFVFYLWFLFWIVIITARNFLFLFVFSAS
jgi:hypothetical protein